MPEPWVGAENDYRGVVKRSPAARPTMTVVMPVRDRADLLRRTLAGLATQIDAAFDVVVVDDHSTEAIDEVAAEFPGLATRVVRNEGESGAGQARNLGARHAQGDVLWFLDSDCIPFPSTAARHLAWHARASNMVVSGGRRDIDESGLDAHDLISGAVTLAAHSRLEPPLEQRDWRRQFGRRTRGLILGDQGFRSAVSANLSMPRQMFESVGGFSGAVDTTFATWGGEDTELGWRLWNAGAFIVPEPHAPVAHQVATDQDPESRTRRRRATLTIMADVVPHRFYRKRPAALWTVPKLTWIVAVDSAAQTEQWIDRIGADAYPDVEVRFVGFVDYFGALADRSDRIHVHSDPEAAVLAARGEFLLLVDGRMQIDGNLASKMARKLTADPRLSVVRCAYRFTDDVYRTLADLRAVDEACRADGLPLLAAMKKRELMKDGPLLQRDFGAAWRSALDRAKVELLINDHASSTAVAPLPSHLPGVGDLVALSPREATRLAVRLARRNAAVAPDHTDEPRDDRTAIDYIGFSGKGNLGDEAVLLAAEALMPWARFARDLDDADVLMVGGGTLINGRNYYLTRVLRRDAPHLERVLLGTGVRNPEYWGVTENMDEWFSFIQHSLYAGVRGPHSVEHLRTLGYEGPIDVFGDTALSLPRPGATMVPGRVLLSPLHAGGNLHGGADEPVLREMAAQAQRLSDRGHEVWFLSAFAADDAWIIEIMREAGLPAAPFVAGHRDPSDALEAIASSSLVIGERLHAVVLAAAFGVPFVAIEYRPKTADFAASISAESWLIKSDAIGGLSELVDFVLGDDGTALGRVNDQVEKFRLHQAQVVAALRAKVEAGEA